MISAGLKTAGALALGCAMLSCTASYDNEGSTAALEDVSLKGENGPSGEIKETDGRPKRFPAYSTFVDIARKATPAVVHILTTGRSDREEEGPGSGTIRGRFERFLDRFRPHAPPEYHPRQSVGSGFLVDSEGLILTNYHVIDGADAIRVRLPDRREFDAKVVASEESQDLALLRIHAGESLPVCRLGDSSRIEAGEWAIAVGSPFGLEHSVTVGVISATGRRGFYDQVGLIQTDAPINYGNSGGPLLNIYGEAVGINTAMMSQADGIGFAVPINQAKEFMHSRAVIH